MGLLRKTLSLQRHGNGDERKNQSQVHETQSLCCLFFSSLDVFITTISVLLGDFFLGTTHKALTYIILIASN